MDDDDHGAADAPSASATNNIVQLLEAPVLLAAIAVYAPVMIVLSSRHRRSNHPALRFVLSGMSAVYFPLMSQVLSYLPSYLSSMLRSIGDNSSDELLAFSESIQFVPVMLSVILIQFLKAKADMAALAVAAVTSPVAGDDIDTLKIRPSIESLIYSFWVAVVVIYSSLYYANKVMVLYTIPLIAPLWILGACRMVLRFTAFQKATRSFALGRNAELIDGYMAQQQQLHQSGCSFEAEEQAAVVVPSLIVTGERNEDVEETPRGYRITRSVLEPDGHGDPPPRSLITLDQVWCCELPRDRAPELRDLCLSFSLFKCLRRRFAGYRLAEAGSSWAFRFVCDGLLGPKEDHERIFQVIADELSFARSFYYSPLPVASLGTLYAALHFSLSLLIVPLLFLLTLLLVAASVFILLIPGALWFWWDPAITAVLASVLAAVNAGIEISEMVASVRSNWTKISIIGHYIRSLSSGSHKTWLINSIFSCLLNRKSSKQWNGKIGQIELLNPDLFSEKPPWAWAHIFHRRHKKVPLPPQVKAAILASLRSSGGQLRDGTATVRRRSQAFSNHISWPCHGDGGEETTSTTTTELLLLWHIATTVFEVGSSSSSQRASLPRSSSTQTATTCNNMLVAQSLSRYCAYLVAEAPDLLPDNSAWTKSRYKKVKKGIEEALKSSGGAAAQATGVYDRLIAALGQVSDEVLKQGSKLGKQLVEETSETPRGGGETGTGTGGEDAVWELLAEFWSEMVLYLAPSDNVKRHIEALQRGGELITLLWALLLHAGITTRPPCHAPEP